MSEERDINRHNESPDEKDSVNEQAEKAAEPDEKDRAETKKDGIPEETVEKKAESAKETDRKTGGAETETPGNTGETVKKKAQAAAKAKGAKARPKREAKKKKEEEPLEPSPNQPILDAYVAKIKAELGDDTVEEATINRPNGHLPTIRVKREKWLETARLLKVDAEFAFDYLKDLTAYDDKDYMSVVVHLYSFSRKAMLAVHIHTERDPAWVPSVTSVWTAADWNEREVYDLFGIEFTGHPNLKRIMMPDDWVGYPLRKDYVPLDEEV